MDQSITESVEGAAELAKARTATKRTPKKPQEENVKLVKRTAVFIERESDLGFRAYRAEIVGEDIIRAEPLHNASDLESIAINLATRALEGSLR